MLLVHQNCPAGAFSQPTPSLLHQKEERTMLEDIKAALSDLDKVTVFFRQLEDECLVASKITKTSSVGPAQSIQTAGDEQLYG